MLQSLGRDRKFFLWATAIVTAIVFIPTVAAVIAAPANMSYSGAHALTPGDYSVYFSFLEQSRQGHALFVDLYTTEPQSRLFFNPVWFGLGLLVRIGFDPVLAFHLGRLLLVPLYLFVLFRLVSRFFDGRPRRFAFLFAVFASGLGVFAGLFLPGEVAFNPATGAFQWPMDLWVPEAFTFLTLLQSPHLITSTLLLLVVFLNILKLADQPRWATALAAGFAGLGLYLIHPFLAVVVVGVTAGYVFSLALVERRFPFRLSLWLILSQLIALPGLIYHLWYTANDPAAAVRFSQNLLGNPSVWIFVMSYGLLGLLGIVGAGIVLLRRRAERSWLFLVVWFVVQLGLILAPFSFQRRLTAGWHPALAILASIALVVFFQRVSKKTSVGIAPWSIAPLVILFGLSSVYVYTNEFSVIARPPPHMFISSSLRATADWLKSNAGEDAAVLTDGETGNLLPSISGRRVYLGHGVETLFSEAKLGYVEWFFGDEANDADRLAFLEANSIDYILETPQTRDLGEFRAEQLTFANRVFADGNLALYAVTP